MLSLRRPANYPAYILHKMVRLVRNGAAVKMSKRLGTTLPHTALLKGHGYCRTGARLGCAWPARHHASEIATCCGDTITTACYSLRYALYACSRAGRVLARNGMLWGGRACGKAGQIQSLPTPQPTYVSRYAAQPWSFCQAHCIHYYSAWRDACTATTRNGACYGPLANVPSAALARTGCTICAIGLPWAQSMAARSALGVLVHS